MGKAGVKNNFDIVYALRRLFPIKEEDVQKVVIPNEMKESLNSQILRIKKLLRRFSSQ